MITLVCVLLLFFFIVADILVHAWIECLDSVPAEYDKCYACPVCWCDARPGDHECIASRKKYSPAVIQHDASASDSDNV